MKLVYSITQSAHLRLDRGLGRAVTRLWGAIGLVVLAALSHAAEGSVSRETATTCIERDWLFQAAGEPNRSSALEEIARSRKLAKKLRGSSEGVDLSAELAELG